MIFKLKQTDKKLLAYLYQHGRESLSEIAKKTNLSREQVTYRIEKYLKEGVIKGFFPIINYNKVGYSLTTLIMLSFDSQQALSSFKQKCVKDKHRVSHGEVLAKYDLFMVLIFQNEKEKGDYLSNLLSENNIANFLVLEPYNLGLYPLKFIETAKKEGYQVILEEKKKEKLEDKDKEILRALLTDARIRVIDIAKQTGLSAELVVYHLKKLKERGILLGSRAYFDMEKLGFFYTLLFINMKKFSSENQEKLKRFAKKEPFIETIAFMFSKPNCYMQIFHANEQELRETLARFKDEFKGEAHELEIIPVKDAGENINTIPFI